MNDLDAFDKDMQQMFEKQRTQEMFFEFVEKYQKEKELCAELFSVIIKQASQPSAKLYKKLSEFYQAKLNQPVSKAWIKKHLKTMLA